MSQRISTEVVNVTPKMAARWLSENNQNNRPIRIDAAKKFARDMRSGNWRLTHQGIAFYADGTLADGQHRLMAVKLAEKSVQFLVTKGLPRITGQNIDQNTPRTAFDAIHIAGGPTWITRNIVAIIRFVVNKMGNHDFQLTNAEIMDYAIAHQEALLLANQLTSTKRRHTTSSGMAANYYCAIRAGEDIEKLRRFAQIMLFGETNGPHENAAIRLREYLLQTPDAWGGSMRIETSKRAQRAIKLFCQGQPVTRLICPDEFIYPAPEDL